MSSGRARRIRSWLLRETREVVALTGQSIWRGFVEFINSDDLTYAASIAYYGLLSLFPFFLLLLSILGNATADPVHRDAVINFIFKYFPTKFDFLSRQVDALRQTRVQVGIGGSAALIWAAMGVFSAISTAVNHAWGVEKPRTFVGHKVFSFLMLLAAGAMLMATLLLTSAIQIVNASWFAAVLERFPGLQILGGLAARYATTLMLVVVVGFIFYFVPNAQVRFRDVWVGAVVTGLLWKGAFMGFAFYVGDMSRFKEVNGSIAAVIVFLIFIYMSAIILMYGVEMTAQYARLRRHRPVDIPAAPTPRA